MAGLTGSAAVDGFEDRSLFNRYLLHGHRRARPVLRIRWRGGDGIHNLLAFDDATEDRVFRWQRVIDMHDKELGTIGVRPSIGHRHRAYVVAVLVQGRRRLDLVGKAPAPGRFAASPCAGWVAALNHKALDDTMEDDIVVVASCGEGDEVLSGFGRVPFQQLKTDGAMVGANDSGAI